MILCRGQVQYSCFPLMFTFPHAHIPNSYGDSAAFCLVCVCAWRHTPVYFFESRPWLGDSVLVFDRVKVCSWIFTLDIHKQGLILQYSVNSLWWPHFQTIMYQLVHITYRVFQILRAAAAGCRSRSWLVYWPISGASYWRCSQTLTLLFQFSFRVDGLAHRRTFVKRRR